MKIGSKIKMNDECNVNVFERNIFRICYANIGYEVDIIYHDKFILMDHLYARTIRNQLQIKYENR